MLQLVPRSDGKWDPARLSDDVSALIFPYLVGPAPRKGMHGGFGAGR